jgi:type II secretory pathway pseudopilin PulG
MMRGFTQDRHRVRAFTLVEVLVASAAVILVSVTMFALLNSSMTLFAKNVSVNMAHQEARYGMMRVVRDLHQAVSIPQLVDANFAQVNTAGPAAGVTFQVVTSGPFKIMNDPTASQLIQVETPNPNPEPPSAGDHIVVLDYDVEQDIIKVTAAGEGTNHWNIFLENSAEQRIHDKKDSFLVCYITRRVGYVVNNGELRFYPNLIATPASYYVIACNVTSATAFGIPLNQTGTPDTRYTAVNLTVTDPTYNKRGFKNTSMESVNAHVPYRRQVTKYQ